MNVDKRKTVHFFNDRSNQVVFRFAGNFCRILPLYVPHTAFAVRYPFGCLPAAGCFRDAGKAGCPAQIPTGCRAVFALYSAFHNTTRMPRNRFRASMPRPGGRLFAGTGKFFKEPRSLLPVAARRRIFSYHAVDKTLTFHFLRATLELPTGQYWPRGNICLGGSLCRKLKKKR